MRAAGITSVPTGFGALRGQDPQRRSGSLVACRRRRSPGERRIQWEVRGRPFEAPSSSAKVRASTRIGAKYQGDPRWSMAFWASCKASLSDAGLVGCMKKQFGSDNHFGGKEVQNVASTDCLRPERGSAGVTAMSRGDAHGCAAKTWGRQINGCRGSKWLLPLLSWKTAK